MRRLSQPTIWTRAFTLVELLGVTAIIAILMTLTVMAIRGIGNGQKLSSGGDLVLGQLDLARQTAMAENTRIELRLLNLPTSEGASWRGIQLLRVRDSKPIGKIISLPEGITLLKEDKFSSLLSSANPYRGKADQRDYVAVRFSPDGSTNLNPAGPGVVSNAWTITVVPPHSTSTAARPAQNFVTIQVDPITGRSQSYRP